MMTAILIDDEEAMRNNLTRLLGKYLPQIKVIAEADGVESGLELLEEQSPNVLFLDVEMKDGTGFDLLSQFGKPNFHVIFVTGHDHYAIKAFKYSAIDYLLKPVDPTELVAAVDKVFSQLTNALNDGVANLISNQSLASRDKKILLKDNEAIYITPIKDIVRCQSDNNYTIFYLNDGRELIISKTLKEYEKLFDDQDFYRSHQSHLINLAYFDHYKKREGGQIIMQDGASIPLSSRKKDDFLTRLKEL